MRNSIEVIAVFIFKTFKLFELGGLYEFLRKVRLINFFQFYFCSNKLSSLEIPSFSRPKSILTLAVLTVACKQINYLFKY